MKKNKPILGSEKFPIVLQPHFQTDVAHRYHWPRKLVKGLEVKQDYKAIEKDTEVYFSYEENIFKNPFLNSLEIRLASYFYQKQFVDDGVLYLIKSDYTQNTLKKVVGEGGYLYFTSKNVYFMLLDDVINLIEDLKQYNILDELEKVQIAIERLVDFGYLTITEISWSNVLVRESRNVLNKKVDDNDKYKIYAHNIRIHSMMDNRKIYKTFDNSTL
jgi:hypothetical protein